jgi:hypothetical protein
MALLGLDDIRPWSWESRVERRRRDLLKLQRTGDAIRPAIEARATGPAAGGRDWQGAGAPTRT